MKSGGRWVSVLSIALSWAALALPVRGETLREFGHGRAAVVGAGASANQAAIAAATLSARRDALRRAVGRYHELSAVPDPALDALLSRSGVLVLAETERGIELAGGAASVDLEVHIDGGVLRDLLATDLQLDVASRLEELGSVTVLAYTVVDDGGSPAPPVLRVETEENIEADVRTTTTISDTTTTRASPAAASSRNAKREKEMRERGLIRGAPDKAAPAASAPTTSREHQVQETVEDQTVTRRVVRVYEQPDRRDGTAANELRARLEELLVRAGFRTRLQDVDLMSREFSSEDELIHAALAAVRVDPETDPRDLIAIALNRFQEIPDQDSRMSSSVTWRLVRIRDGLHVVPPAQVVGESGPQPSKDMARAVATEAALSKIDAAMPQAFATAAKALDRESRESAAESAEVYRLRVDNVDGPHRAKAIKDALRAARFQIESSYLGASKSETIEVRLDGASGSRVAEVLEPLLEPYEVVEFGSARAVLRLR